MSGNKGSKKIEVHPNLIKQMKMLKIYYPELRSCNNYELTKKVLLVPNSALKNKQKLKKILKKLKRTLEFV
jgi:cystathionine beta-lyase/cystathionine gamma-synthase